MKRYVMLLLLGLLLLAGCGTGNGDGEAQRGDDPVTGDGRGSDEEDVNEEEAEFVEGEVAASIQEDGVLEFLYEVTNPTDDKITLEFSTSQRYDYSVETTEGDVVHLFSSVAMFLQVEGKEELQPGDELVYDIDINEVPLDPGDYILKVWLTPKDGATAEVSMEFTVE